MIVCIAEKPSVAGEIAKVLGARSKKDGYYEGNGYQVTWTFGHLCQLKSPDGYYSDWKKWDMNILPMIPPRYQVELISDAGIKKQFKTIKELYKKADTIVNCGDAGQEGELIQRWVMELAGVKCPVKRLWISSLTEEAIREGFRNLQPQSKYDSLYKAGQARAEGDWLLGMNATRLYTLKFGGYKQVLSIGRVQTPTLAMIVDRDNQIENFKPEPYWVLVTKYRDALFTCTKGRFCNESEGRNFLEAAKLANPSAPYYGESLYELGRAYVALKDNEDAIRAFRTLRSSTQDPALECRALLELGMIARNEGKGDEAIGYYKQVVEKGGDYADDALLAIESIYRTREDPEAYLAYVNSLGSKANRTEAQKEEVYFSSAEQVYLSGDYSKAIGTLQAYLEKYPKATYGAKARFYLAECYRINGNREQAADLYLAAMDEGLDGALSESALVQYALLNFDMGNFGKAYGAFLKVKETAKMDANKKLAAIGLMRSAFKARQWDDALVCARDVMDLKSGDEALEREALYVRAKSYMSTSRRDLALADFRTLSADPSTPEGAEAAFLLIQDQYDRGSFDDIPEEVFSFSAKAAGQNYWLAKAFIVLGDTYAERGELTQARATFESIRDGYTAEGPQDDVLDQVELRLRKLQK